jgi:hypothetical protein
MLSWRFRPFSQLHNGRGFDISFRTHGKNIPAISVRRSSVFVLVYGMPKRKRLGRPKKSIDPAQAASSRADGNSWRTISCKMGVSVGTVFAAAQESYEIPMSTWPQAIGFLMRLTCVCGQTKL